MATLDDKLLGEKLHYYCSSSESENEEDSGESGDEAKKSSTIKEVPPPEINKWEGSSTNTGPKGVIKDWQRFKQLETEKRAQQERERLELIKKLSLTCRSALDDERDKAAQEDPELADLLADEFLYAYQKQRMQEMLMQTENLPAFGELKHLKSGEEFLDAIDKEHKSVTVIIHIYEDHEPACRVMNECLVELSKEYPRVKFCKIVGSTAGLSRHFKVSGVPALLVYKDGQMIGNFVRVSDELGDEFYPEEVENFLVEHGMLFDKNCIPPIIKQNETNDDDDDDE